MRKWAPSVATFIVFYATVCPLHAGGLTWVSGAGVDTGTCLITAPCRTFAYAHGQTASGGSIYVLSSGNFGPVIITKSMSIVARGVEALIDGAAGGAAISVQAPAGASVSLRGLTIDLGGTSNAAIAFTSGTALHVRDTHVRRSLDGIRFKPSAGVGELYINNVVVSGTNQFGIIVEPTSTASARVSISNTKVENGNFGVVLDGSSTSGWILGTIRDSICDGNSNVSVFARDIGTGLTALMLHRVSSVNSLFGLAANGSAAVARIGESTITGNGNGITATNGATIASFGTNHVNGNEADGGATATIALK